MLFQTEGEHHQLCFYTCCHPGEQAPYLNGDDVQMWSFVQRTRPSPARHGRMRALTSPVFLLLSEEVTVISRSRHPPSRTIEWWVLGELAFHCKQACRREDDRFNEWTGVGVWGHRQAAGI